MRGDNSDVSDRRVQRDQRSAVLLAEAEQVDIGDLAGPGNSLWSEQRAVAQRDTVGPEMVRRRVILPSVSSIAIASAGLKRTPG